MGKRLNTKMLMLTGVIILGIYVLPSAVAKFAGSHTWEFNATTRVTGLQCGKCHQYIVDEINNSDAAQFAGDAVIRHLAASNTSNYINTTGAPLNFSRPATTPATLDNVCWMCHVVEGGSSVVGTHTKTTIRVCTDVDCHGFDGTNNDTGGADCIDVWDEPHCNVTGRLNSSADAHFNFFQAVDSRTSPYGNENGGFYSYGFVACLGCHTHVGLDLNLTRPFKLTLAMDLISVDTGWNTTFFDVNDTAKNTTIGGKDFGSVWKP
jgi:hypothetical protein